MGGEAAGTVDDVVVIAGEITTFGIFDLDHARAEVGEDAGTHRSGDGLLHRDDGDAGQWC
jgi:hypothetical protein